jgi:hypothetical protein
MPPTSNNEETPKDPRDSILPNPSGNLSRSDKQVAHAFPCVQFQNTCWGFKRPSNGCQCHEVANEICEAVHRICRQCYILLVSALLKMFDLL